MIVLGAHAVRQGETPSFAAAEGMRRDLFLVERENAAIALDEVVSLVATRLPEHYGVDPVEGIQVFAPVYKGPLGIDALNLRLRDALNPHGEPVLGGRLRIGDKLMLSGRNLHELGLMNGTILRLLDVKGDGDALIVSADGAIFTLPGEEAPRLGLAYACSVHKGQGIELPVAILVAHPAAGRILPAPRDALHGDDPRARGHRGGGAQGGGGARRAHARHRPPPLTPRRTTLCAVTAGGGGPRGGVRTAGRPAECRPPAGGRGGVTGDGPGGQWGASGRAASGRVATDPSASSRTSASSSTATA